jgi:thymidylate synthase
MTNKLDKQYQDLLKTILEHGIEKTDRTGVGTKSIFGYTIRHNMQDGFPALTTKKLFFKGVVGELIWFLNGDTNIKYLIDNGIHIWDGDAYKAYEKWYDNMTKTTPFEVPKKFTKEELVLAIKQDPWHAEKFGELGPIYGKQWRAWGNEEEYHNGSEYAWYGPHDQIKTLIDDLRKNPDSRRLMVNAWNVSELKDMTLPPCHYGFQCYTRDLTLKERVDYGSRNNMWKIGETISEMHCDALRIPRKGLSLMWSQRSVDTLLGLPFNIASYGLLLEILAKCTGMMADQLIGNLGDTHLYMNHLEQAKEQIGRKYTHEERVELLKAAMGENQYGKAVDELVPFGGGMSEYYYDYQIPEWTREPYPLPKLWHGKTDSFYRSLSESVSLFGHLDINDFELQGYKHHKTIKAPLNN